MPWHAFTYFAVRSCENRWLVHTLWPSYTDTDSNRPEAGPSEAAILSVSRGPSGKIGHHKETRTSTEANLAPTDAQLAPTEANTQKAERDMQSSTCLKLPLMGWGVFEGCGLQAWKCMQARAVAVVASSLGNEEPWSDGC